MALEKDSSRASQPEEASYYYYKANETDPVDREVARFLNLNRERIIIPVAKVDYGYLVGTEVV